MSGLPVRVIATLITKQSFFLYSRQDIRRVSELKSKRVAISNFASSTDNSARAALKHFGLESLRDVQKGLNNLVWLGDILGDVPSNGLSTTTKKLKEQPEQVHRMLWLRLAA